MVLEPVVNIPRRTIGKKAEVNPEELNGQINFFTTSGFRGSSEHTRNLTMIKQMINLEGVFVMGTDWQLACAFGRGETKSQILKKKEELTPISFAQNYCSKWVGAGNDALIDINKLMELRTLTKPILEPKVDKRKKVGSDDEYYLGVDVARSQSKNNNQSSIVVLKVLRNKDNRVKRIQVPNIINLPNALNFKSQAIEIKRYKKIYNARIVVLDSNGLGKGLEDELLKDHIDPITGDSLGCWDTINNDNKPEEDEAEKCLFALNSQGLNTDIIVNFIDMVDSKKIELLHKVSNTGYDVDDYAFYEEHVRPCIETDMLLEEVANIRLKYLNGGKMTIERVTSKVDKDRYAALVYPLWYINTYEDKPIRNTNHDISKFMAVRKPALSRL